MQARKWLLQVARVQSLLVSFLLRVGQVAMFHQVLVGLRVVVQADLQVGAVVMFHRVLVVRGRVLFLE